MNDGLIPYRYARALYKLATERGDAAEIYEQLKPVSRGSIKGLDEVKRVLLNPYIPEEDKGRVMVQLTGAKPGSSLERFMLLVIRNGRAQHLRRIAMAYVDLYRERHDIAQVDVTTASDIAQDTIDSIVDVVKRRKPGITLEIVHRVDPELIGGFTVKVGDTLLDASVKNELNKMRLTLQR